LLAEARGSRVVIPLDRARKGMYRRTSTQALGWVGCGPAWRRGVAADEPQHAPIDLWYTHGLQLRRFSRARGRRGSQLSACSVGRQGTGMPSCGSLSHIDISVGSPESAIPFYHAVLSALGYKRWTIKHPEWSGEAPSRATWGCRNPDGSRFEIEVRPALPELRNVRYDRYRPGPHHIAFHADSDATVDAAYHAVVAVGGEVLDAPHDYGGSSGYGAYYYAAFFADPDGFKVEVCHVPEANP